MGAALPVRLVGGRGHMGLNISTELIDRIRAKTDIVALVGQYVKLEKRGADYWGYCPFHMETAPSFKVSSSVGTFYCFGCRRSGNALNFLMNARELTFLGAVRVLAERAGVALPEGLRWV